MAKPEYVALLDGGTSYKNISDADTRRQSYVRGGGNSITKVDWAYYIIVRMPGEREYRVAVGAPDGLLEDTAKLIEIRKRWWAYSLLVEFKFVRLYYIDRSLWQKKNADGQDYYECSDDTKFAGDWVLESADDLASDQS